MNSILLFEIIYVAGFLDADGSIIAQLVPRQDYKFGFQIHLTIQFTQHIKRRYFLEKLKHTFQAGYVRDRADNLTSDYVITETKLVYDFLKKVQPYLRLKRKQADLAITIIEQLPLAKNNANKLVEIALMVDQIADLNDTKKRIHTSKTVIKYLKDKDLL